jgi:hypothetical protein
LASAQDAVKSGAVAPTAGAADDAMSIFMFMPAPDDCAAAAVAERPAAAVAERPAATVAASTNEKRAIT